MYTCECEEEGVAFRVCALHRGKLQLKVVVCVLYMFLLPGGDKFDHFSLHKA